MAGAPEPFVDGEVAVFEDGAEVWPVLCPEGFLVVGECSSPEADGAEPGVVQVVGEGGVEVGLEGSSFGGVSNGAGGFFVSHPYYCAHKHW